MIDGRVVYRFERDEKNGCWYNEHHKYSCTDPDLMKHEMPYEPKIYKKIYSSGCFTLRELLWWVPLEVAERLVQQGCTFVKYISNDYFIREHGEVCFNKTNHLGRITIPFEFIKECYLNKED